jgi:hypothetical protein
VYRKEQWEQLEQLAATEFRAQTMTALRQVNVSGHRTKDLNINENAARVLETSQKVMSTNDFGLDPLAVHTKLHEGLPQLWSFANDDVMLSDDEQAPGGQDAVLGTELLPSVTAVVCSCARGHCDISDCRSQSGMRAPSHIATISLRPNIILNVSICYY